MTVLILGCSIMQKPAIETALKKGWKVIGADINEKAFCVDLVDEFIKVDISKRYDVLKVAEKYFENKDLDGIFTAGTDFSSVVAFVASSLGLPSISFEVAEKASKKDLMRKCFLDNGVSSPKFFLIDDDFYYENIDIDFPLVVKPIDNMGARGTKKVFNLDELKTAVVDALAFSRSRVAIVEEFIDGDEFSIDAIVENGEIKICGVADRHIFFPPYFIEMGHTIPSSFSDEIVYKIVEEFKKGVRAIGIDNCAAKGDIKFFNGKAYIGEIAARLSGGFMSGWTYPYSSGVNVTSAALNLALGMPSRLEEVNKNFVVCEKAIISIPGKIKEIINDASDYEELFLLREKGDIVNFPKNNVEKVGNIIVKDIDRNWAEKKAFKALGNIFVKLEPLEKITEDFLIYGNKQEFIPNAYILKSKLKHVFCYKKQKKINSKNKLLISFCNIPLLDDVEDWNKKSVKDSIKYLLKNSYYTDSEIKADLVLDELFWRVFISGSLQGAIWLAESLQLAYRRGELDYVLEKWKI